MRSFLGIGDNFRNMQHRLGWNAADIEAHATEGWVALDQYYLLAQIGGAESGRVPSRSCSKHHYIGVKVPLLNGRSRLGRSSGRSGFRMHRRRWCLFSLFSLFFRRRFGYSGSFDWLSRLGWFSRFSGRSRFQHEDKRTFRNLIADLDLKLLNNAGFRRRNLNCCLVSFQRDKRGFLFYRIASVYEYLDNGNILEVPDIRDFDFGKLSHDNLIEKSRGRVC